MSTPIGPPLPAPLTLRGALSTLPVFLRRNVPALVASAVAAGIIGWVVNVWMLAVKFEGNNDVPTGSPVTGQNNTNWASIFWVLFSMVLFGAVGYARAVGMRRFLYDLRTTPRLLFALARRDGTSGRVHLLWGAALALLLGLAIPPAVGAVVSVGLLATLPTIIGAIAGSVLGRMFTGVLKPFRPGAQPIGIEAMIVGLVGSGLALAIGFVVPDRGIRLAAAAVCILLAVVMAQQLKTSMTVAVTVVAVAAYQTLRWVLHAKHVLADDGGFAECGLDFGTWWRQCQGAGAVRRQAIPGGVASALGSPVGLFLGSWAGSVSRLVPNKLRSAPGRQLTPKVDTDPVRNWHSRPGAWHPDTATTIDLGGGHALLGTADLHGHHSSPWLTVADRPPITPDPLAHPQSFPWRAPAPGDPFATTTPATGATAIAERLNHLHHNAPGPEFLPEVRRLFQAVPQHSVEHNLEHISRLEHEHHSVWSDRLAHSDQAATSDMAHRAEMSLDSLRKLSLDPVPHKPLGNVVGLMREQVDRFADVARPPTADSSSAHHLFHNGRITATPHTGLEAADAPAGAPPVVQQLETTLVQMQRMAGMTEALPGHTTATALGHHQGLPYGGPVGIAGTGMHAHPATPFTGHHGLAVGLDRSTLPLPTGPQLVDAPGGHAVVTAGSPGGGLDLGVDAGHTRSLIAAPDHVDRLASARQSEQAGDLTRQFDAMAARTHQLELLQHQAEQLASMRDEMGRVANQIAGDPAALRNLATTTPWRAPELVQAVRSGSATSGPLSQTVLPRDADLAWFANQHRDLALAGTDHTALATQLGPSGAPGLVSQLERMQQTMHQMHDMRPNGAALDQLTEMRQMLADVVAGRLDPATAGALSQQQYGVQLEQLAEQAQRAMAAMQAQQALMP